VANGQIAQAIHEASERLAAGGYTNADLGDVMLVGFGYMVDEIRRTSRFTINFNSRTAFPLGAVSAGALAGVLRVLGIL